MDVASRNSAVECRSARAFSSLEIAYCLSGIAACRKQMRAGYFALFRRLATAFYAKGHAFIGAGKALLVLRLPWRSEHSLVQDQSVVWQVHGLGVSQIQN